MPLKHQPGVLSLALSELRKGRCLLVAELAKKSGRSRQLITRWETEQEPSWETLVDLTVRVMQYELDDVLGLVYALSRALGRLPRVPSSPIAISEEELRAIRRATGPLGRAATDSQVDLMIRSLRAEMVREERAEAEERCRILLRANEKMRLLYIQEKSYQTWAVAERLSEMSEQAAGQSARLALELANLACKVAETIPGEEAWRARVLGFCLAFLANAWRVAGEPKKAEEIFVRALDHWRQGEAGDPERILPVWRLLDREASLRRDLREFVEGLRLHQEARTAAPREVWGRILVSMACTYDQMFEAEKAIGVLQEAAPLVEEANQPRLRFQAECLMAVNLCHLSRYREAEDWVRRAFASGVDSRNELELMRARWLTGRVAAGLGQTVKALEAFRAVRWYLGKEKIAYDFALASLEEARLLCDLGQYRKVQEMVVQDMKWIFEANQIDREALASLTLLRNAVECEIATSELVRRVHEFLVRAEKDPDLRFEE
jgi:tetratricopeptide (TPR) repeat protein